MSNRSERLRFSRTPTGRVPQPDRRIEGPVCGVESDEAAGAIWGGSSGRSSDESTGERVRLWMC